MNDNEHTEVSSTDLKVTKFVQDDKNQTTLTSVKGLRMLRLTSFMIAICFG